MFIVSALSTGYLHGKSLSDVRTGPKDQHKVGVAQ